MTGAEMYVVLQFWGPMISAFGLAITIYRSARKSVTTWAERLFDNHLTHIEKSSAETVLILHQLRDINSVAATKVEEVKEALQLHNEHEHQTNEKMLSALEILKDRKQ